VTVMGVETHKRIWTYNDGLKAVFVGVVADAADLVFNITLGDSSVMSITDVEAQSVPEPAMAALDQVLRSLGETR